MTFFVSMVPVLELRGAIPMGVAAGLSPLAAMIIAIIGNMVPVPFIILFTRKIFRWLRTKGRFGQLVEKLENRAAKKSAIVKNTPALACAFWWRFRCPAPAPGPALWWPPF